MELWLTLVALYAWQCIVWLRAPSAVFGPGWLGPGDLHRRGVQLASPWPSTPTLIAARWPFRLSNDARSIVIAGRGELDTDQAFELDGITLEVRNTKLRVDGRLALQAASKAQARDWQHVIGSTAACTEDARPQHWRSACTRSLDHERLSTQLEHAQRVTRWLRVGADVMALAVFVAVPLAGLSLGSEFALARAIPGLAALHLVVLALAFVAHRRLFRERVGERAEEIFMAALYPPALLRRPAAWVDAATAGYHPLAWVRILEAPDHAQLIWRREGAWLERRASAAPGEASAIELERDLLEAAWPDAWQAPDHRTRVDPTAESYCPVCWDDFRSGFDRCAGCDVATVPYPISAD